MSGSKWNTIAVACLLALGALIACGESTNEKTGGSGGGTGGDDGSGGQGGTGAARAGASGSGAGRAGGAGGGSAGSLATGGSSQAGGATNGGDSGSGASGGSAAGDAGAAGEDGGGGEQGEPDREQALWPMPNPPSSGLPNPQSYVTSDDTVTDQVTELVWERQLGQPSYSLAAAQEYCEDSSLAGFDDWRMPTLIELVSIIDWTAYPTIDDESFPDLTTAGASHWSSTPTGSGAFVVELAFGSMYANPLDALHRIRCVRAGRNAPHRFEVEGATVREVATGLVWERVARNDDESPFASETYCDDLVLESYDDWRLPGVGELATLIDVSVADPALDRNVFPEEVGQEELAFWAQAGWLVDFNDVGLAAASAALHRARCVR